jgi:hypothetical protein
MRAGDAFLECQRRSDATYMARSILDPDEHDAAGRIGERDDRSQQSLRR